MSSDNIEGEGSSGNGRGLHNPLGDSLPSDDAPSIPQSKAPPDQKLGVWASPLTIDEDSGETFGFGEKKAKDRFKRARNYYLHNFVGPMPVEEFLDAFMHRQRVLGKRNPSLMPPSKKAFESVPQHAKKESDIYEPLIDSLNRSRCPGFLFLNTSARSDNARGTLGSLKPDVCCYEETHAALVRGALTEAEEARSRNQGATVMGYAALFIEIKGHSSTDPFRDPPPGKDRKLWKFILNLDGVGATKQAEAQECFGQNTTYAAEILARQHRQFLYSVSLCGSVARLIRWDRAGAVCTNAFDIRECPEPLCQFFWCFAAASDMDRGYDLNVEIAYPYEHNLFLAAIRRHLLSQAPVVPTIPHDISAVWNRMEPIHFLDGHVTAIRIPLKNSNAVQRLLVSRPLAYPLAAFGNGTRTYWAVDVSAPNISSPPVVLLKDTWRENPPSSKQTESKVVERLNELGVSNVPKVLSCEDVVQRDEIITVYPDNEFRVAFQDLDHYQCTRTQDFLNEPWVCGSGHFTDNQIHARIRKYTHHRLVLDAAGPTLAQFCGTNELLATTLDVLLTLNGASKELGIVHRALSPRSIILYRKPDMPQNSRRMGYLIDWDHSWKEAEDLNEQTFSPPWQFVCSALAAPLASVKRYTMEYDMEALFYVVLYLAILCLPPTSHSQEAGAPALAIKLFGGEYVDRGQPSSNTKQMNKTSRKYTENLEWKNPQMKRWMDKMLAAMKPLPDTTPDSQWTFQDVKILWEELLADTRFEEDRMDSLVQLNGREADAPHALRAVPNCPTMSNPGSLGAKRDISTLYGGADPVGSSFVKRMRTTLALETLVRSDEGPQTDEHSTAGAATFNADTPTEPPLTEVSGRRGAPETSTNAEAGPSRLLGSRVDAMSSSATASDAALITPVEASASSHRKAYNKKKTLKSSTPR